VKIPVEVFSVVMPCSDVVGCNITTRGHNTKDDLNFIHVCCGKGDIHRFLRMSIKQNNNYLNAT
jgi:hypothetical protein